MDVGRLETETPFSHTVSTDVLRIIFEVAIDSGGDTFMGEVRYGIAYNLCLISKDVAGWIEPLLYRTVLLESDNQIYHFSRTLRIKSPDFLSQHVRALWLLQSSRSLQLIDFEHLFATLHNLQKLSLPGYWFTVLSRISSPSPIQDLTLIVPQGSHETLCLQHLSLRSLHIIDASATFVSRNEEIGVTVHQGSFFPSIESEVLQAQLDAIPKICLDFTEMPPYILSRIMGVIAHPSTEQQFGSITDTPEPSSIHHTGHDSAEGTECHSLWVKTTPFTRFEDSEEESQKNRIYWESVLADYKRTGPANRPLYNDSPLSHKPEHDRIRRLPWLNVVKECICYNQLHWDRTVRHH